MTVKNPKCLVIDASILRASKGEEALHPTPVKCRDFMDEVLKSGHTVIRTPEIKLEWDKHIKSAFAQKWYTTMLKRGLVRIITTDVIDADLREKIFKSIDSSAKANVEKDMCLVEASLLADEIVASLDNKMRGHFRGVAQKVTEIASIVWVNPIEDDEECIIWLRQSALADDFRQLGYRENND